jgi:hypothetical protein
MLAQIVMAALVAATYEHPCSKEIMGGRDKPGHDDIYYFIPNLRRASVSGEEYTYCVDDVRADFRFARFRRCVP